jgi:signal transduction histidine kinase
MTNAAKRLTQIVGSLNSFSHMDESKRQPADIHECLNSTLIILNNYLKGGIQLIKNYGNLPPVNCYSGQLSQVFMNIISNAIDALNNYDTQRSEAEIQNQPSQIKIRTEVSSSDTVTIRISDNGPGMSDQVKTKLFEPFFTTKPPGKGTGLGLSISSKIVREKHKGSLQCDSTLGQGTEFLIKIPIEQNKESFNDFVMSFDPLENMKLSRLRR